MTYKVRSICLKFSTAAVFMLFLQSASAQNKFADFEGTIEERKKELGNDLMVIIANKDTILYQKIFGDITNRTQVTVGAASAWFTTALVLQLVDEGKISLEDKVSRYLPIYDSYFKSYITIRHCLAHMTGIQMDAFKTANLTAKRKYESLEEEANDYAKKEIQTNAGEEFRFNGIGFNIAARIVEVATKKKFEQLMRQRIFTPLGMRNTSFSTDDGSPASAFSQAKSSAADFTKFLQMLLNNGKFNGKQILSEAAVAEMKKVQASKNVMKFSPKAAGNFMPALGTWAIEGGEELGETATALASPGLLGVWPLVDFKRGYTLIIFPKNVTSEQNANVFLGLKQQIDEINLSVKK